MGSHRLALLLLPLGLLALLAPERAEAQICDRPGYTRQANCPNEARDATGCCPAPPRRAPGAPSVTPAPADEACPMTQVRTTSGRCCWPGQRGTASGCVGRPRSCPLGWEAHATGCLPAGTRAREMVLIPPVDPEGEAFLIDRTPVTVQAYRQCVADGACDWREPERLCNGAQHRTHPMNCILFEEAQTYCEWAGGLRLPTAAEWTRAAGGTDGRRYPWGDALPDDRRAHWGRLCARPPCTAPVGRRAHGASPYGVLDLAGNVWEQTADGQARGGHWSSAEHGLRIEANRSADEGAEVGFRCAGDLVWDYVDALGESESNVARRPLETAFVELALARRDLRAGAYAESAARFEGASATLERAGHTRAFVFRYHAAAAHAQAGATEAAEAQLAAYFEAGGAYPPPFEVPDIERRIRLAGWERTQPRWAQREGFRSALGGPPASMSGDAFEALLSDLVEATMSATYGLFAEAGATYAATARRLREAGHAETQVLWAYATAAFERGGDLTRARRHYAIYLDSGGDDPPALEGATVSEATRRGAEALRSEWRELFRAGHRAFAEGAYADARRAFEGSYADVDGHPRQASAKLGLARAHEGAGDVPRARAGYFATARLAPAGSRIGDYARAQLRRMGDRLTAKSSHTCAIVANAQVACWGRNHRGQLGNGTQTDMLTPTLVAGLRDIVALTAGEDHACALRDDGRVYCWGRGLFGRLGDGSETDRASPVPVHGLSDMVAITAGGNHTCAIGADGQVHCWGLDDATRTRQTTPAPVPGMSHMVAITAGDAHTCALGADARITCWRGNYAGQLGNGSRSDGRTPTSPTPVVALGGAVAIAAYGHYTCAVGADTRVHCWGQLGDDIRNDFRTTPTPVTDLRDVVAIAAGRGHTCALSAEGRVHCWGVNRYGQVGDGSQTRGRTRTFTPTTVQGLGGTVAIAAGSAHTCALGTEGQVHCWGIYQYGDNRNHNRTLHRTRPTPVAFSPRPR